MFVIGITGQFASGKSTVAKILGRLYRAAVIDADKIGHSVLSDKGVKKRLVEYFGKRVIVKGAVDRKAIAKLAFANRRSHKILCGITHPILVDKIKSKLNGIESENPKAFVIIDAAVLIEMGLLKVVDKLIVVKLNRAEQIRRAQNKWRLSPAQITKRIKLQIPASRLFKKADFIIDNSNNLEDTKKQVKKIRSIVWQKMKK